MEQRITRYIIVDDEYINDEECRKAVEEWIKSKILEDLYKIQGELVRWHPVQLDNTFCYPGQTRLTQKASFIYTHKEGEQ